MTPHTINIGQFRQHSPRSGHYYRDQLIVTDRVDHLERFRSPCRIDAVTVVICVGGELECSVNLRRYLVGRDTLLVNLPDDILQIHRSDALEAYAVVISSSLLGELAIDIRQRSDFFLAARRCALFALPHGEVAALKPYYALLSGNISTLRPGSAEIVQSLARAFAYTLFALANSPRVADAPAPAAPADALSSARSEQMFNQFMALVKVHHGSERSVKFYADRMCLTPNYMSGVIKKYSGKSAAQWIDEYVVLEAKTMLRDAGLNVQQVAYRLNFPNQSAFGKYFKQLVGVGPRQYRCSNS